MRISTSSDGEVWPVSSRDSFAAATAQIPAARAFERDATAAPDGPPAGAVTFLSAEKLSGKWDPCNHALLSCGGPVISPAHVVDAGTLDETFVGTGPFRWLSYEGEEAGVKREANTGYWDGALHLAGYVFRFAGDSQTRRATLQPWQAQIIDRDEPDRIPMIEPDPNLGVGRAEWVESKWLTFRIAQEPMNTLKLPQAIAPAIDVASIVENIMMGSGKANSALLTASHMFAGASDSCPTYAPEKAKALLAGAGYRKGEGLRELTCHVLVGFCPKTNEYGQFIVQTLADIGIEVTLQTLEVAKYNQMLFGPGAGDLFDHGWFVATTDPEVLLSSLLRATPIPTG
ncbi:MAG: hypothetical protein HWE37_10995 [Rhodobacteraceae bacterium]|uniref:ABC transporter substrate-binding protein n=1 Tax=Salipiger sp. HF18 TaxID=2721557 RepID=UPI00142D683E|nr:hypothetical protein [Paracoccaceae bacterium]